MELCANLMEGGTTPSLGRLIMPVAYWTTEHCQIVLFVTVPAMKSVFFFRLDYVPV